MGHRAIFGFLAALALSTPARAATSGSNGSHDPSRMLECDGKVYIYSTGGGAKSSSDGLNWQSETAPTWNRSLPNNQGIWAPDGLFLNGQYLLYGSMWNDSKASAIVLLTSPSLDPQKAKWTDRGVVVSGPSGVTHSVIDPAPLVDNDGNLWVVWGGGYPFPNEADSIFLTRLDNDTGLPLATDAAYDPPASPGHALKQGHKEGPYIHFHEGYYYLFWQTGGCCSGADSTYLMHVARSEQVTGPYLDDRNFYGSTGSIHGPGHMGIYSACGFERFTYHYYPDSGGSVVGENELEWSADGWPQVGAEATQPLKLCGEPPASNGGTSGTAGVGGGAPGAASGATTNPGGGTAGASGASGGLETPALVGASAAGTSSTGGASAGTSPSGGSHAADSGVTSDVGCSYSPRSVHLSSFGWPVWLTAASLWFGRRRPRPVTAKH